MPIIAAVLFWGAACLHAHNGSVALGVPVEGIAIDGDLADWPQRAHWQPIEVLGLGAAVTEADLSGRFALGYNTTENALYCAVEVNDDSIVLNLPARTRR